MAGSLNKVMLVGRLGQDPKLAYTASGTPVANFNMATDETYNDREGNRVEQTEWHRIVVWSKQAELCANYLSKGRLVLVEGKLQTRKWEDQQGQPRYTTEIVAQRVQFLDSKQEGGTAPSAPSDRRPQTRQENDQADLGPAFPSEASGMDDVPF
ncbi:MAG: single-stranded DNA-binding protein [Desulfovibrionales bacterium]